MGREIKRAALARIEDAASNGNIQVKLPNQCKQMAMRVRNPIGEPPADDPERLFNRFFRADFSRPRESGGRGEFPPLAKTTGELFVFVFYMQSFCESTTHFNLRLVLNQVRDEA